MSVILLFTLPYLFSELPLLAKPHGRSKNGHELFPDPDSHGGHSQKGVTDLLAVVFLFLEGIFLLFSFDFGGSITSCPYSFVSK